MLTRSIAFLLVCVISLQSFALCDSKDIIKNENGTYTYSRDCHLEVGKTFKELELRKQQIDELKASLILKDSLTVKLEQQSQLWMDTSFKLNDKIQKYEQYKSDNQWVTFGAGVLTTVLAAWAVGQAAGRK